MGASSVTGTGQGIANKPTLTDLGVASMGPQIYASGWAESTEAGHGLPISPPGIGGTVTLIHPLPGLAEDYVVILTTINAGYAYIIDMDDDDLDDDNEDDHFVGFSFLTEAEGDVMYVVTKVGIKPTSAH